MKALLAILFVGAAQAQVYVAPYVTKNGTFVQGHYRSAPNDTKADNYSTPGNVNPFNGQQAPVAPPPARTTMYPGPAPVWK